MSADEIRRLAETLKIWREECGVHPVHIWDAHIKMEAALLDYAAMVERCEKLRFNMIPHRRDTEIVDYIVRGDAGKEER